MPRLAFGTEVDDDFGNGLIEFLRYELIFLGCEVKRFSERLVLDNRDAVLFGDFANLEGEEAL